MDTTSPFVSDGLAGPAPLQWTPDIKALTAYSTPLGFGFPGGRVRRGLAGLAIVAAVTAPAMAGTAAAVAGSSPGATSAAHAADTWT